MCFLPILCLNIYIDGFTLLYSYKVNTNDTYQLFTLPNSNVPGSTDILNCASCTDSVYGFKKLNQLVCLLHKAVITYACNQKNWTYKSKFNIYHIIQTSILCSITFNVYSVYAKKLFQLCGSMWVCHNNIHLSWTNIGAHLLTN